MPDLSLLDVLSELSDPRSPHSRQYPFVPRLFLCLVATLARCTSVAAIARFGRLWSHRLGHALGFRDGKMPCANTITNLLAQLDPDHLDRVIGVWLGDRHADGWGHIALDGKTVRGSRDEQTPGLHLLAAYALRALAVIAQVRVDATTNEHTAALRLLGVRPLKRATTVAVVYGITSQKRRAAAAARLLWPTRDHWGIENGLQHTRDATFGEDRCGVRRGTRRGCWRLCGT